VSLGVAVIGAGRMGREVASLAESHGASIVAALGRNDVDAAALSQADVAIEFTEPASAVDNIACCVDAGCPVVVGTTGWYDQLPEVEALVSEGGGSVLWAPNFSPGFALMRDLAARAAASAAAVGGYGLGIVEAHHTGKLDAPSGTALRLRSAVAEALKRDVAITSVRVGHVPGTHDLVIDGPYEQLLLRHEVRDRRVFADGALLAARWLHGRKGLFTFDDVLTGDGP